MVADGQVSPHRVYCPDCGVEAQMTASGWRCPWATASSRGTAWVGGEMVLACRAPYDRARELVLPTQTRTR
jgi:hypothetical protein